MRKIVCLWGCLLSLGWVVWGPVYGSPGYLIGSRAGQLQTLAQGDSISRQAAANRLVIDTTKAKLSQKQNLGGDEPLPVVLTNFSGRVVPDDCTATLAWQTASERNSYAYEVQGSADGQAFSLLGTVPSRNRATGATYSFRIGRLAELRYFRLRMLDIGGAMACGPVITLTGCAASPLLVAPTPTRDLITVSGLPAGRCLGVLYSATGQVMTQATGTATIDFHLSSLPAGIYLLKVLSESGATVGTARVVKE